MALEGLIVGGSAGPSFFAQSGYNLLSVLGLNSPNYCGVYSPLYAELRRFFCAIPGMLRSVNFSPPVPRSTCHEAHQCRFHLAVEVLERRSQLGLRPYAIGVGVVCHCEP